MPRAFISHATEDRRFVENSIIKVLKDHGIDTWYSKKDIHAADAWERAILTGLESCDSFVIVMSPHSARSEWVKDELAWAFSRMPDRIIPVMCRDCDPLCFHLRLPRIQHIDFRKNFHQGERSLLAMWGINDAAEFTKLLENGDMESIRTWIWGNSEIRRSLTSPPRFGRSDVLYRDFELADFRADLFGVSSQSIICMGLCSLSSPDKTDISELISECESLAACLDNCSKNPKLIVDALCNLDDIRAGDHAFYKQCSRYPEKVQLSAKIVWGRRNTRPTNIDQVQQDFYDRSGTPINIISYDRVLDLL